MIKRLNPEDFFEIFNLEESLIETFRFTKNELFLQLGSAQYSFEKAPHEVGNGKFLIHGLLFKGISNYQKTHNSGLHNDQSSFILGKDKGMNSIYDIQYVAKDNLLNTPHSFSAELTGLGSVSFHFRNAECLSGVFINDVHSKEFIVLVSTGETVSRTNPFGDRIKF